MWDCVSLKKKKAIEPGKSTATLHRNAGEKTNSLNNELPAWKEVSGFHSLFLFSSRKSQPADDDQCVQMSPVAV